MKMKYAPMVVVLMFCSLLFQNCNIQNLVELKAVSKDTMTVYLKQQVLNEKYGFIIQLDSITEDSRCPEGAECFWAGDARAKFKLTENNIIHQFSLNTLATFRNDTIIGGIRYKLINLSPYPSINKPFNYNNYSAVVAVSRQ